MRSRLLHRLIIWMAIPLLCAVGFVYVQINYLLHHFNKHLADDLSLTLGEIAKDIQQGADYAEQLSLMLARSQDIVTACVNRQADYLYRWGNRLIDSNLVDFVYFLDDDGIVLARGHAEFRFNDKFAETNELPGFLFGQEFTGIAMLNGILSLVSISTVYEYGELVRGVIIVGRSLDHRFINRFENEHGMELTIAAVGEGGEGNTNGSANGLFWESRFLDLQRIPGLDPVLIRVNKDFSVEQTRYQTLKTNSVLVTAGVFGLALLLIYISLSRILKPLRDLNSWLERYRSGSLGPEELTGNVLPEKASQDEIGFIARSAYATLLDLEKTRRELHTANRESQVANKKAQALNRQLSDLSAHLERKVTERTKELVVQKVSLEKEVLVRKQAEETSQLLSERLQTIIDVMPDIILRTDSADRINQYNKAAGQSFEQEEGTLFGLEVAKAVAVLGIDPEVVREAYERGVAVRQRVSGMSGFRYFDVSAYACHAENSFGKVVRIEDVTTHVLLENELLKAEKLRSVGVLAGGIAHDFNNLLTSIIGNINLAQARKEQEKIASGHLSVASKACLKASELTKQLLTFSRGGDPLKEDADLIEIIEDSVHVVLPNEKISCNLSLPGDTWSVRIDRGQISQVMQNIVLNACQAMVLGGELHIECCNVRQDEDERLRELAAKRFVQITIADTGPGISEDNLNKVFDPYFSTKENGSGLGLAICYSIIEKHGGGIFVASAVGRGTSFSIFLPAAESQVADQCRLSERLPAQSAVKRILLMDDDQIVRDTFAAMLEQLGHEVVTATNGERALVSYQESKANASPFDVVIMDLIVNDGMGGKEAADALLKLDPQVKIIVASGYSSDPIMSNYEAFGFAGALAKPFDLRSLQHVIEGVFDT